MSELYLEIVLGGMGSGKTQYGLARLCHLRQMSEKTFDLYFWSPTPPPTLFVDGTKIPNNINYLSNNDPLDAIDFVSNINSNNFKILLIDESLLIDWSARKTRNAWKRRIIRMRHNNLGLLFLMQGSQETPTFLFQFATHITLIGRARHMWQKVWLKNILISEEYLNIKGKHTQCRLWHDPEADEPWSRLQPLPCGLQAWPIEWPRK